MMLFKLVGVKSSVTHEVEEKKMRIRIKIDKISNENESKAVTRTYFYRFVPSDTNVGTLL